MLAQKNIVLIGFMGSGKSAVARKLSEMIHQNVVSLDDLIEKIEGRSIRRIFKESGETHFREKECEVVKEVSVRNSQIIDCGGGVVLNPDNIRQLRNNGIIIYFRATADTIFARVKNKKNRPLLQGKDPHGKIKELLAQRKAFYEQADYTIETDNKTIQQICDEIIAKLNHDGIARSNNP